MTAIVSRWRRPAGCLLFAAGIAAAIRVNLLPVTPGEPQHAWAIVLLVAACALTFGGLPLLIAKAGAPSLRASGEPIINPPHFLGSSDREMLAAALIARTQARR